MLINQNNYINPCRPAMVLDGLVRYGIVVDSLTRPVRLPYCGYMDISLPALAAFVEQLIDEKFAGTDLDEAVRSDIRRELTDRLNQYLTLRTIEIVSEADPDAITKLSELIKTNPSPEQVQQFISGHVKEPDLLVARIFSDFRALYIGREPQRSN